MSDAKEKYVMVYVCRKSIPDGVKLRRQWLLDGYDIRTKMIPCSGRIDVQYILHSFEAGADGVCVVACPEGECSLSQGNYRAKVRIETVRDLLEEIGMDVGLIDFVNFSHKDTGDQLHDVINDVAGKVITHSKSAGRGEKS